MATLPDLRKIRYFADCPDSLLRDLAPACRRVAFRKGQPIHDEQVPLPAVHAVLAGEVLLYRSSGAIGASRLAVVKSGELFGFGEALLPVTYTAACALSACSLLAIDRVAFVSRFLAIPSIREHVLRDLSTIARFLVCKVTGGGGRQDLALYLRARSDACGIADGPRIRLQSKQRQPEIASLLNLSREHVTRLFARLKAEGVVDFNRGFPLIDPAWLDREAPDRHLAASILYRDARVEP